MEVSVMRYLIGIILILLIQVSAFAQDEGDNAQLMKGKRLYEQWCAQCHGYEGDGKGYSTDFTFPAPRDFSFGVYKFRSTPSGDPPTDDDIIRSIRRGNPGTSMPPWERFSDDEVKAIVAYVKEFAPDIFEFETEPVKIEGAPEINEEIIKKGKELFKVAKCIECHGEAGRGNGEKGWEENFKDDWGNKIYPANYTHPWELRNGASLEDIYRTITTGLSGTPMTSYQDSLTDEERWALAAFIKSLQKKRKLGIALPVRRVESLPSSTDDPLWEEVDYMDIPLAGQIIFEPRNFRPTITNARVRAVYTDKEVAIMLEWTDKRPNRGDDGMPPDSVRLQLPLKITGGAEKPYFVMGDRRHPVNIWQWKASDERAEELNARGVENINSQERQDLQVSATYDDGLYRVIFRRKMKTGDEEDTPVEPGRFIPFSVTICDGQNNEEGHRGVISAWYYLMLEPPTPVKVYILPPFVTLAVLGMGIGLHRRLRKNK
jgi:DMSO reductase family type II enzyme heme b subunit